MNRPKDGEGVIAIGNNTGSANTSVVLNGVSSQVKEEISVSDNWTCKS